jgi:hypothetical protein
MPNGLCRPDVARGDDARIVHRRRQRRRLASGRRTQIEPAFAGERGHGQRHLLGGFVLHD